MALIWCPRFCAIGVPVHTIVHCRAGSSENQDTRRRAPIVHCRAGSSEKFAALAASLPRSLPRRQLRKFRTRRKCPRTVHAAQAAQTQTMHGSTESFVHCRAGSSESPHRPARQGGSSLPRRQLRKFRTLKEVPKDRSLPRRQLRNASGAREASCTCSLPRRQLRKFLGQTY